MIRDTIAGLGPEGAGLADGAGLRDQPVRAGHRGDPRRSRRSAAALRAWPPGRRRVREAWPGVAVDHVESLDGDQVEVGTKIHVSALVRLGELTPDDVEVQLITGRMGSDDRLYEPRVNPFPTGHRRRRRAAPVRGLGRGQAGRGHRLHRPGGAASPAAGQPAEMGLAALPATLPVPADYAPTRSPARTSTPAHPRRI